MIKSDDPDQYRHYVQRVLTCAFRSKSGNYESSDIARLCISYSIEDNLENKTILRIKVNPYPYDVVEIALDDIPTGYVNAYLRQSGETARLTEALRRNVEVYKRNALKNTSSFDVLLQQALEERNVVELVDYQSASKCATRRIHVYKLWPRRQLIYGYDLDRKAPRLFKATRCRQIVLTDETWKKHLASPDAQIDVFGMLVDKDNIRNLEMLLNDYAKAILIEEYPGAEGHIIPNYGSDRSAYPWRLICRTSNPAGLLRFSRGLPDATKLNENQLVETV